MICGTTLSTMVPLILKISEMKASLPWDSSLGMSRKTMRRGPPRPRCVPFMARVARRVIRRSLPPDGDVGESAGSFAPPRPGFPRASSLASLIPSDDVMLAKLPRLDGVGSTPGVTTCRARVPPPPLLISASGLIEFPRLTPATRVSPRADAFAREGATSYATMGSRAARSSLVRYRARADMPRRGRQPRVKDRGPKGELKRQHDEISWNTNRRGLTKSAVKG